MVGAAEGDKYNLALVSVVYNQVTQLEANIFRTLIIFSVHISRS